MSETTTRVQTVEVELPLPPMALGKNGRCHWAEKARLYRQHREWSRWAVHVAVGDDGPDVWPAARLYVTWRYSRGREPDDSNAWGRLDAYRDGAEDARLVHDDRTIRNTGIEFVRVPRGSEGVVMRFVLDDAGAVGAAETE